jgi:hypothetical protein
MTHQNNQTGKPVRLTQLAGSLALLIFLFSLSVNVFAQGGATVKGRVTDERGASVPGAEVHLRSRSGIRLFGRTNEEGIYAFNGLASGDYILEVTARGFAVVTSEELRVERGQEADVISFCRSKQSTRTWSWLRRERRSARMKSQRPSRLSKIARSKRDAR